MTFNIRLELESDAENNWPNRKNQAINVIEAFEPDLIGFQEVLPSQRGDLEIALSQFNSVGGGREADGLGEASPIFYRKNRYDLLAAGMYWLSDTPEVPGSMTWGNMYPRICTWVQLLDRHSTRRIWVVNTHWDHESQNARLKGSKLMAKHIDSILKTDEPLIVSGDFNAGPKNQARQVIAKLRLQEAFFEVHPADAKVGTHHSFTGTPSKEKIDAILVSQHWAVRASQIDQRNFDGRYPSDHFPVIATLQFK